jgi:hypothetical protein
MNDLRVALYLRQPPLVSPSDPVLTYTLVFKNISRNVYCCVDCAFSQIEWYGSVAQIERHAQMHRDMAAWYESMVLPLQLDARKVAPRA